ncbi:hypothetical protein MMC09_000340 [Bachmanniomyces sp. S44760]|nr:hypothetical protein [Bachmanniomyces sp. S44760]
MHAGTGALSTSWVQSDVDPDSNQNTWQQQHTLGAQKSHHKRLSSSSSAGSAGPASPCDPTSAFPHIVDAETNQFPSSPFEAYENSDTANVTGSKSIPTERSAASTSFLAPVFQDYNPSAYNAESFMAVQTAMRQALMAHQSPDLTSSNMSAMGRDLYREGFDDGQKGVGESRNKMPSLDRTLSDVYQDELYSSAYTSGPQQSPARAHYAQGNLVSPASSVFSERLQAASNGHLKARSTSPQTDVSRERSPFREGSKYAVDAAFSSSSTKPINARLGTAAQLRERAKAETDARVLADHQPSDNANDIAPKTISPQEALLDYNETEQDARSPLFSQESSRLPMNATEADTQRGTANAVKQEYSPEDKEDNATERSYTSMATTRRQSPSDFSTSSVPTVSRSAFPFVPPSVPGGIQIPQQYPFISHSRRQNSMRSNTDSVPEFPAHLTSMESTKSETGSKSENGHTDNSPDIQRPAKTTADTGTYTCTYHGCTLRFETPAKLQKHKRDRHRQSTPLGPSTPVSSTPSASSFPTSTLMSTNASRNSQAGPHKCERTNPSTGKPCNSIFSRPYDLTRHEDTIHNGRKQKVRCQLCTEEKTFSRNDALTRHMRVVHPEVDFPGKTRRRGN